MLKPKVHKDDYAERNRERMTASKLKDFLKNPRVFYLKYIKIVDIKEKIKRYFIVGNAVDCLLSYGKDRFLDKYYIDKGYVKGEIQEKLLARFRTTKRNGKLPDLEEIEQERKRLNAKEMLLDDLRVEYYGADSRIRLTPGEGDIVLGVYREVISPNEDGKNLADFFGKYSKQVVIEAEYEGVKIRGQLDRFIFFDKSGRRYSVKWVDNVIKRHGKGKRLRIVKEYGIKGYIRDRKTAGNVDNFEYDMEETFDYVTSMAYYYVLVLVKYGVESSVALDVLSKKDPYPYYGYKLPPWRLRVQAVEKIKPGLQAYKRSLANDDRPLVKPLTGEQIHRNELVTSPYYPYIQEAKQRQMIAPGEALAGF